MKQDEQVGMVADMVRDRIDMARATCYADPDGAKAAWVAGDVTVVEVRMSIAGELTVAAYILHDLWVAGVFKPGDAPAAAIKPMAVTRSLARMAVAAEKAGHVAVGMRTEPAAAMVQAIGLRWEHVAGFHGMRA